MKKQIAYFFQKPKLDLMSLKKDEGQKTQGYRILKLTITMVFVLFPLVFGNEVQGAEVKIDDANLAKSKYITGTLDREGAVVLTKEQIAIPGLDFSTPNFLVQAYIQSRDYWVVASVFIGPDGLTIESSRNFSGKKYRIVIVY